MTNIYSEILKFLCSEQAFIAVFGVLAIGCSQSKNKQAVRYASIFGLIGQPFWFYMAWNNQTWGVFVLCILYTLMWGIGFKNHWLSRRRRSSR